MREHIALIERQNTGDRREIGQRMGEDVDPVGFVREALRLRLGHELEHAAGHTGVEAVDRPADGLPERGVADAERRIRVEGQILAGDRQGEEHRRA